MFPIARYHSGRVCHDHHHARRHIAELPPVCGGQVRQASWSTDGLMQNRAYRWTARRRPYLVTPTLAVSATLPVSVNETEKLVPVPACRLYTKSDQASRESNKMGLWRTRELNRGKRTRGKTHLGREGGNLPRPHDGHGTKDITASIAGANPVVCREIGRFGKMRKYRAQRGCVDARSSHPEQASKALTAAG